MEKDHRKRERIRQLLDTGLTVREIASVLGLTTQRVYQLRQDLTGGDEDECRASAS